MWDHEVFLIQVTKQRDDIGDMTEETQESYAFCNEKSIGQSEFYQAHAKGFKPEIKLEINTIDYNNQQKVRYKGREYRILRTYTSGEITELTLEGDIYRNS